MFGFVKKKPEVVPDLQEIRNMLKDLVGETMNVHIGVVVGHLVNLGGKTAEDVEKSKERMLTVLQAYVKAEILLNRQNHGHEPSLAELDGLRLK